MVHGHIGLLLRLPNLTHIAGVVDWDCKLINPKEADKLRESIPLATKMCILRHSKLQYVQLPSFGGWHRIRGEHGDDKTWWLDGSTKDFVWCNMRLDKIVT